jgi:capsular exopolysaccharide synthesis family protein
MAAKNDQPVFELAVIPNSGSTGAPVPGPADDGSFPSVLDFGLLFRKLLRRWWVIALCAVAGGLGGFAYTRLAPRIFSSTATIRVEQERRLLVPENDPAGGREDIRAVEMLKTIEHRLGSQSNLLRVIEANSLREDTGFARPDRRGARRSDAELIGILQKRVRTELRRGTRLIDIRVEDTDPERACRLARSVVDAFIAAHADEAVIAARHKSEALRETAGRLSTQLDQLHNEIQAYRETYRELSLEKDVNIVAEKLKDLNAKLTQASADRNRLEAARRQIESLGPEPPVEAILKVQGATAQGDIAQLQSAIDQKEAELARLSERYKSKHPKFIQARVELAGLKEQLAHSARRLVSSLGTACAHAAATETGLRNQIAEQQSLALQLEDILGPFRLIQSRLHTAQASFDAVQAQIRQADVAAAAPPVVLSLADHPVVASAPTRPRKKLAVAAGVAIGLVAGLTGVMAGMLFGRRIGGADEAERFLRLPRLASIPRAHRTHSLRDGLLWERAADSECANAFRALRAALAAAPAGSQGAGTFLFTGARPGEGTSFVAMNFAAALARQGFRTLLIDANLVRPGLDTVFFEKPNSNGLASFLAGKSGTGRACRPTPIPELYLLGAGPVDPASADLLAGRRMSLLIEDARRWFHRIVIDAPSLAESSDALVTAAHADHVITVINETTPRRAATELTRRFSLGGHSVSGFVFNGLNGNAPQTRKAAPQPQERLSLTLKDC